MKLECGDEMGVVDVIWAGTFRDGMGAHFGADKTIWKRETDFVGRRHLEGRQRSQRMRRDMFIGCSHKGDLDDFGGTCPKVRRNTVTRVYKSELVDRSTIIAAEHTKAGVI